MIPIVVVDPSTIWVISGEDTPDTSGHAIEASLAWLKPHALGPLRACISLRSLDALATAGAFPVEDQIRSLLDGVGLTGVINAKDIASNVSRFLAATRHIEEESGVIDVLLSNRSISPYILANIPCLDLREISDSCLSSLAVYSRYRPEFSLYAYPRLPVKGQVADVSAYLEDIDGPNARVEDVNNQYTTKIGVLSVPSEWPQALSASQIWFDSETCSDLEVAIWLEAQRIDPHSQKIDFRVGSEFLDNLVGCEAAGQGRFGSVVLEKCGRCLLPNSGLNRAPFRVSSQSSSAVRTRQRDGAKAWRLHVTGGHEALRLMYWELPGGGIEFASVKRKFDLEIDEGDPLAPRSW